MIRIFSLIIIVMVSLSCERRPLEEIFIEHALIPVKIDWSDAFLDPDTDTDNLYNASVWLYAKDGAPFEGKSYKEYSLVSAKGGNIEVPMGDYRVIVFNNSIHNFGGNVGFRGMSSYDTFAYYIRNTSITSNALLEPDILAAWRTSDFEVTKDMIVITHNLSPLSLERQAAAEEGMQKLTNVRPVRLTCDIDISVYAKNIKSGESSNGVIHGIAQSVKLWSGVRYNPASYLFHFKTRFIDDDINNWGRVWSKFRAIGSLSAPSALYQFDVRFKLVYDDKDGNSHYPPLEIAPRRFDATSQVSAYPPTGAAQRWIIWLDIGDDKADPDIILPELKPGGWDVDVGGWGDEEDMEFPI